MIKFSKNKKLQAVLADIWESLEAIGYDEVLRYAQEFPKEDDLNLVQYSAGNFLPYHQQIREWYASFGYKFINRVNDDKLWGIYRRQVGYVARIFINRNGK